MEKGLTISFTANGSFQRLDCKVLGPPSLLDSFSCYSRSRAHGTLLHRSNKTSQPVYIGLNNILSAYEDKSAEAVCTFAYSDGKHPSTNDSDQDEGHDVKDVNNDDSIVLFQGRTLVGTHRLVGTEIERELS